MSSLVMLGIMPFLNQNNSFPNTAMVQEYDNYGDSSNSQYQPTIRNTSVEQVRLKDSL
jgi:hypothetical protein